MVTVLAAQLPVTPAGRPEKVAPVAPVVASVILVMAELIQTVWLVPGAIVLSGVMVMVCVPEAVLVQLASVMFVTTYIPGAFPKETGDAAPEIGACAVPFKV